MRHDPEIDASAEELREGNRDEGGGSVVGFHLIKCSMDGSDEFLGESIGFGV